MKKLFAKLLSAALALTLCFSFASCKEDKNTITVGASSAPHAEILEQVKDDLKAKGYTLKIKIMDDYVTPNTAVDEGEIDANYFQHVPYLDDFNANNGTNIVSAAKVHYEPFGVYGNGVTKDEFNTTKTGRTILIPNDGSNGTRALFVLQEQGYITLKEGVSASDTLSTLDIADAKGNTVTAAEASTLPALLKNANNGTIAVINGNYAISSGLKIADALATESATGEAAQLYANIIAVKKGNENSEKIKALVEAVLSQKVYDYINTTYAGAVKPVFTVGA